MFSGLSQIHCLRPLRFHRQGGWRTWWWTSGQHATNLRRLVEPENHTWKTIVGLRPPWGSRRRSSRGIRGCLVLESTMTFGSSRTLQGGCRTTRSFGSRSMTGVPWQTISWPFFGSWSPRDLGFHFSWMRMVWKGLGAERGRRWTSRICSGSVSPKLNLIRNSVRVLKTLFSFWIKRSLNHT